MSRQAVPLIKVPGADGSSASEGPLNVHAQVASAIKAGVRNVWLDDLGVKCKDRARETEQRVGST